MASKKQPTKNISVKTLLVYDENTTNGVALYEDVTEYLDEVQKEIETLDDPNKEQERFLEEIKDGTVKFYTVHNNGIVPLEVKITIPRAKWVFSKVIK